MLLRDGRAFRARWRAVAAAERRELSRTTIEQRLRQLAALMASAGAVGGERALAAEDRRVRRRWLILRRALGAHR